MASHPSVPAWEIPCTEGLVAYSHGSQRVGRNRVTGHMYFSDYLAEV